MAQVQDMDGVIDLIWAVQVQAVADARSDGDVGEALADGSASLGGRAWLELLGIAELLLAERPAPPRVVPNRLVELRRITTDGPVFARGDVVLTLERGTTMRFTLTVGGETLKTVEAKPQSWRKVQAALMREAAGLAG